MWETGASAAAGWECTAHLLRAVQAPGAQPCSGMRSALAYNQDLQASGNVRASAAAADMISQPVPGTHVTQAIAHQTSYRLPFSSNC